MKPDPTNSAPSHSFPDAGQLVLARRWRPRTFAELIGQQPVVQALVNGLNGGRLHHAFLLTGTRGVGKTSLARILARCLNCEEGVSADPCGECAACTAIDAGRFVDLLEVDAASRTRVEDTRELLDNVQFAPTSGRFKIYLIDEVHMLSGHSFNALLKTLEEPPPHVKFILATTDPQKVPVTILSRCLRFNLRRVDSDELHQFMQHKLERDNLSHDPASLRLIARAADGSVRDALSLLDQALSYTAGRLEADEVQEMLGLVAEHFVGDLLQALAAGAAGRVLELSAEMHAQGQNVERLLQQMAERLHRISVLQQVPDFDDPSDNRLAELRELARRLHPEDTQLYYQIAVHGQQDLRLAPDPHIGLEMCLLRMLAFRPASQAVAAGSGAEHEPGQESAAAGHSAGAAEVSSNPPGTRDGGSRTQVTDERLTGGEGGMAEPQGAAGSGEVAEAAPAALPEPQHWARFCRTLQLNGQVRLLASHLQLLAVHADGPRLEFAIERDDRHLADAASCEALQRRLGECLGCAVELSIGVRSGPLQTPARAAAATQDAAHERARRAVEQDSLVNSLIETFDAEIVPGSIRPGDAQG